MTGPSRCGPGKFPVTRGGGRTRPYEPRRRPTGVVIREPSDPHRTAVASDPPPPPPPLPPYAVGHAASEPVYTMMPTPGYTGPTDEDETQPPSDHEAGDGEGLDDLRMDDQEQETAPDGRTIIRPVGRGLVNNLPKILITSYKTIKCLIIITTY